MGTVDTALLASVASTMREHGISALTLDQDGGLASIQLDSAHRPITSPQPTAQQPSKEELEANERDAYERILYAAAG